MVGIIGYMSGGKSYFAVEQILKYLSSGHRVCTNIKLNCKAVTSYTYIPCIFWKQLYFFLTDLPSGYHQIATDDYENYPHGSPRGSASYDRDLCYCFLDEASSIFDSMVHAADSNIQKVAAWARHTEKRGIRVFLIMQFETELHKRLRVHITHYIKCVNTSSVKLPLVGVGVPFFLRGISLRRMFLADCETPIGPIKASKFVPEVYDCYSTSQIVVGGNDIAPYIPPTINYEEQIKHKGTLLFTFCAFVWFVVTIFIFVRVVSNG